MVEMSYADLFASMGKPIAYPSGSRQNPAACFARRVKRATQKHSDLRNSENMV
jgi:hypothetical protein